jgi:hypothetical protein
MAVTLAAGSMLPNIRRRPALYGEQNHTVL